MLYKILTSSCYKLHIMQFPELNDIGGNTVSFNFTRKCILLVASLNFNCISVNMIIDQVIPITFFVFVRPWSWLFVKVKITIT